MSYVLEMFDLVRLIPFGFITLISLFGYFCRPTVRAKNKKDPSVDSRISIDDKENYGNGDGSRLVMKCCEAVCRHNGSHTIQVGILHQACYTVGICCGYTIQWGYFTVVILSSGYTIQWAYFTGIMMGRRPRHHL